MKRLWGLLAVLFLMMTGCSGTDRKDVEEESQLVVVTSFYPIYLLAQYVTEGVDGIVLENMAQPQTGCLHDYELTTQDMKLLEEADVFLMNGLGMESFLDQAREQNQNLYIVETAENAVVRIEEECEHEHAHGEGEEEPINAHVWLNPENAIKQAEAIRDAMIQIDPKNSGLYEKNTEEFMFLMQDFSAEAESLANEMGEVKTAAFHEGFIYLEELFGMQEEIGIFPDENQTPSAREMTEAVKKAKAEQVQMILTADDAGKQYAQVLAQETGAKMVILNPLTSGQGKKEEWIDGMRENMKSIAEAYHEVIE